MSRRRRRSRRTWPQRLLIGLNVVLFVAALATAAGLGLARNSVRQINTVVVADATRAPGGQVASDAPRNYLVIGVDDAGRLDPSDPTTNGRENYTTLADVVMILRVDPRSERAHLLSIPRDTTMDLYPTGIHRRINAAISGKNGPRNLIETIKRNLGIPIDHYVQVDFLAFKTLVGQLGGIPVYVNTPIRDKNTGIHLTTLGCQVLNQDQALAYARSRHMSYLDDDGQWKYEPTGDPGRVERQQQFAKLLMHEAIRRGVRNPARALAMGNAVAKVVTMDDRLTIRGLIDVGNQFQTFSPDDLVTQIVPTEDYLGPQNASYQRILWDKAEPLLDIYRGIEPGQQLKPDNVIVQVVGPESANPADVSRALGTHGFDAYSEVDDSSARSQTVIRYGTRGGEAALMLARQLNVRVDMRYDDSIHGPQVNVELGRDFGGVRATPADLSEIPADQVAEVAHNADLQIGPDGNVVPSTAATLPVTASTVGSDGSTTTPTTGTDQTTVDVSPSSAPGETAATGDTSTTIGGSDTTDTTTDGTDSTSTTSGGSVLERNSSIAGGFVPLDYQKSLAC